MDSRLTGISIFGVVGVAIVASGCSSVFGDRSREPMEQLDTSALRAAGYNFDEKGAQRVMSAGDGRPSVVLEVRHGKRHFERIPLQPDKPTFIQDIVDDAQLVDRIGKIQVTILRPTSPSHPPIRMLADFDPDTKRIVVAQNYAVQPDDQIIVAKDTRSWFDKLSIIPKNPSR